MVQRNTILAVLIAVVAVGVVYMLDPTLFGLLGRREGFENVVPGTGAPSSTGQPAGVPGDAPGSTTAEQNMHAEGVAAGQVGGNVTSTNSPSTPNVMPRDAREKFENMYNGMAEGNMATEGFENLSPETMPFPEGKRPANCYPKNQLAPQELLPNDPNSKWAQVNPMASGDIAGKNFLNAGALIGVNTVGQSLRNANWDIRAAPPNPQVEVSPWLQSTISPDLSRRPLDIA
jgi:hypothetical protein